MLWQLGIGRWFNHDARIAAKTSQAMKNLFSKSFLQTATELKKVVNDFHILDQVRSDPHHATIVCVVYQEKDRP
eukprot:7568835-Pyramimonas_sp.AAC.1